MSTLRGLLLAILSISTALGCATTINGTTQTLTITSEPSGAQVYVAPLGYRLTTPGHIELARKGSYTLRYDMAGYKTVFVGIDAVESAAVLGNLLLGGAIGVGLDESSGGAYQLVPNPAHVVLKPLRSFNRFDSTIRVAMPTDARSDRLDSLPPGKQWDSCRHDPVHGKDAAAFVRARTRAALLDSGIFNEVVFEAPAQTPVLEIELRMLCGRIGLSVDREEAVGHIVLAARLRSGERVLGEQVFERSVSQLSKTASYNDATTEAELLATAVADALRIVLYELVTHIEKWTSNQG